MFRNFSANSASSIFSSSAPVTARLPSCKIPSSFAIAAAVSTWSPVIITGRIPASRHSSIAAFTSGRTGSIMPHSPKKQSSCSSRSASSLSGFFVQTLCPHASTRSARSAMDLFACKTFFRYSSVMGRSCPSSR